MKGPAAGNIAPVVGLDAGETAAAPGVKWLLPAGFGAAALAVIVSLTGAASGSGVAVALFLLAALAFGRWVAGNPSFRNTGVPDRIRWALAAAFGLTGVSLGGEALLSPPVSFVRLVASLVLLSVGGAFFAALLWTLIRDLSFVRQKAFTRRNFGILLVFAGGAVFVRSLSGHLSGPATSLDDVFLLLTILFAVINGFRQSWVHYLLRRQKLAAFWASLLVAILCVLVNGNVEQRLVFHNAAPFRTALGLTGTVGAIYFGMSCLALLLTLPAARAYDRRSRGLASLQRLSEMVSSIFDVEKLVQTIPRLAAEVTDADAAWLELRRDGKLRVVSALRVEPGELEGRLLDLEEGLSGWILRTGQSFLSQQLYRDARAGDLRNVQRRWQSLIGVPVAAHERRLGVLYVASYQAFGFEPEDGELLLAFANQSAVALENASLIRESIEKQRLQEELRVARDAQQKLLPTEPLELDGAIFDGLCVTANDVGGDYFDYFPIGHHRVAVVIADVAGKGASAAFYMAEMKGVVETLSRVVKRPSELLIRVNEVLSERMDRKTFISLIYAVVDTRRGKVRFARAGHCPLAHVMRDGTVRFLEPKGVGIGLVRGAEYAGLVEDLEFTVLPGETVFLFTDGLTEAMNPHGEEFGEGRVSRTLSSLREAPPDRMKQGIVRAVEEFVEGQTTRHDDLTFVIVRFGEPAG